MLPQQLLGQNREYSRGVGFVIEEYVQFQRLSDATSSRFTESMSLKSKNIFARNRTSEMERSVSHADNIIDTVATVTIK